MSNLPAVQNEALVPFLNPDTGELEMRPLSEIPSGQTEREPLYQMKVLAGPISGLKETNPTAYDQLFKQVWDGMIATGDVDDPANEDDEKARAKKEKTLTGIVNNSGTGCLYLFTKSVAGDIYIYVGEEATVIPLNIYQGRALMPNLASGQAGGPLCKSADNKRPSTEVYRTDENGKVVHKTVTPQTAKFAKKITGRGSGGGFEPAVDVEINLDYKPIRGVPEGAHFCTVTTNTGWDQPHCVFAKGKVDLPGYGTVTCKPSFALQFVIEVMHPLLGSRMLVMAEAYFKGTTLYDGINLEKQIKDMAKLGKPPFTLTANLAGISSAAKLSKGKLPPNPQAAGFVVEIVSASANSNAFLNTMAEDEDEYKLLVDQIERLYKAAQALVEGRLSYARRPVQSSSNLLTSGEAEEDLPSL